MRVCLPSILVLLAACASPDAGSLPPTAATRDALVSLRIDLQDAIARGDRGRLQALLDDSFVFVHSTGKVEMRDPFIERMVAAAADRSAPQVVFTDDSIRVIGGDTVVWISRSTRKGGSLSFIATDVLVKRADGWKWVSVQSTRADQQRGQGGP